MRITLVVAMAQNRVIGRDNALPWHLPEDLKHFRALTMGKPIVMGRRTFESIGKALPGRTSIVISRQSDPGMPEGVLLARSLPDALVLAHEVAERDGAQECMVIGGAEVYRQSLPLADRIELTLIERDVEGDTLFPEFAQADWHELAREQGVSAAASALPYVFVTLERVQSAASTAPQNRL